MRNTHLEKSKRNGQIRKTLASRISQAEVARSAKPKYIFTKPLVFIAWNIIKINPLTPRKRRPKSGCDCVTRYPEIRRRFLVNVMSTGYYGAITAKAVDYCQRDPTQLRLYLN